MKNPANHAICFFIHVCIDIITLVVCTCTNKNCLRALRLSSMSSSSATMATSSNAGGTLEAHRSTANPRGKNPQKNLGSRNSGASPCLREPHPPLKNKNKFGSDTQISKFSLRGLGRRACGPSGSVLRSRKRNISKRGSQIPETRLVSTGKCLLKVQHTRVCVYFSR